VIKYSITKMYLIKLKSTISFLTKGESIRNQY
jgi:hypothetical protein